MVFQKQLRISVIVNTKNPMRWSFKAKAAGLTVLPVLLLFGCASPMALKQDFANYSEVYADSSNRQLLLNLAREAHEEPAYFIQLASISSQYQFSTSAGFTPTASRVNPAPSVQNDPATLAPSLVQHTLTMGGSLNAGVTQSPVFQFLPLTGSNFVQTVMSPVSDRVFLTFIDQGWPADWVARTILECVQVKTKKITGTNEVKVVEYSREEVPGPLETNQEETIEYRTVETPEPAGRNAAGEMEYTTRETTMPVGTNITEVTGYSTKEILKPVRTVTRQVPVYSTNVETFFNSPNDPTYPKFLEFCDSLRDAEFFHTLAVERNTNDTRVVYRSKDPDLTDVAAALAAGLNVQYDPKTGECVASKTELTLKWAYQPSSEAQIQDESSTVAKAHSFLAADAFAKHCQFTFKTRTFEAIMYSVANEERLFKKLAYPKNLSYDGVTFTNDPDGLPMAVVSRGSLLLTNRPILTINYEGHEPDHLSKLIEVAYKGENYTIGDIERAAPAMASDPHSGPLDLYQNRTVFSLLSYLFAQIAINTQNLPVQQLIQVQ